MKPNKDKNKLISTSSTSFKKKLKTCDLEIKNYIRALEVENLKLHKQIAKLQVKNMSLTNQVNVLIKELEKKGPSFSEFIQQVTKMNRNKI